MFFTKGESKAMIQGSIDDYGDSYARDISLDELREVRPTVLHYVFSLLIYPKIFKEMLNKYEHKFSSGKFRRELTEHDHDLGELPGWMFKDVSLYADYQTSNKSNGTTNVVDSADLNQSDFRMKQAVNTARFAGAEITTDLANEDITHVLVGSDKGRMRILREKTSRHDLI